MNEIDIFMAYRGGIVALVESAIEGLSGASL